MSSLEKKLLQCKHPNSRKTKALTKQIQRKNARQKSKMGHLIKQSIVCEKLMWFKDNLDINKNVYSRSELNQLIESYLNRFNEEMEQIARKNAIGQRKNRQHANREDIIKMTIEREKNEFNTCGIELPNLLETKHLLELKSWNGEPKFLQNFVLKRITKKSLTS